MRKRLTEEAVKRLKPPAAGKAVVYDAVVSGLLFVVNSGGSKSWMALTYRQAVAKSGKNAGKEITMPSAHRLGRYPIMDLKHAREAARAFLTNPNRRRDDRRGRSQFQARGQTSYARRRRSNKDHQGWRLY